MKSRTALRAVAVSVAVYLSTAAAASAAVIVRPATPQQTIDIQYAAQDHCGYRNASSYLFELLVSSNGYAVGTPDARNPRDQGDGLMWFQRSAGHWRYGGCGSSGLPRFVGEIEEHAVAVKAESLPEATRKVLYALTVKYVPDAETAGAIVYTNLGWASLVVNPVSGEVSGSTVVVFKHTAQGWTIFAQGLMQNLLPDPQDPTAGFSTLRNIPAQVLEELETRTYIDLRVD